MATQAEIENAKKGLTPEQLKWLGGADPTDPYIRARGGLPPLDVKKPDGTSALPFKVDGGVTPALAFPFLKKAGATIKVESGKPEPQPENPTTSGTAGKNLTGILRNPLENFASMTTLWTMACLTPYQFNDPSSYRREGLGAFGKARMATTGTFKQSSIVFSSAGRGDWQRTKTAFGSPEYFVDNFVMVAVVAANTKTGNQNAISFTFDVYEPYSMGLFLQTLQNASIKAGYINYLDAPFVLKLDFVGYNEDGTVRSSIKPKFFVLKLKKVTFNVDESGSKYAVEAYPFNHNGYADTVNTSFTDIKISSTPNRGWSDGGGYSNEAGTVRDVLATGKESLVALLNENEEKNVKEKRYSVKDVYEIQFPEISSDFIRNNPNANNSGDDLGATADPGYIPKQEIGGQSAKATAINRNIGNNAIARSDFGFDQAKGGTFPFLNDKEVVDEKTGRVKRGIMEIDPKKRQFQFMQKQSLTEIINQVILSSTYAKQATQKAVDSNGFIDWFKIDVQIEMLEYDELVGDYAKKYTYRVVPFKVHSSVFGNPNAVPPGYSELEKQIVKRYDYIYTGQNTDVLNFEIKLDYLFFSGANPATEAKTKDEQTKDHSGTVSDTAKKTATAKGSTYDDGPMRRLNQKPTAKAANLGKSKVKRDPNMLEAIKGGAGYTDVERKIAQSFQKAFTTVSSADLVKIDLEILGDTFWLVDSGVANYFSPSSDLSPQVTEDGTMNYEGSDVYIYISFRTPADINVKRGLVEFSNMELESPFSGIYRVFKCESKFDQGKFTQTLSCVRMQGQPQDYDGKPLSVDKNNSTQVKVGGELPEKTAFGDDWEWSEDEFYG